MSIFALINSDPEIQKRKEKTGNIEICNWYLKWQWLWLGEDSSNTFSPDKLSFFQYCFLGLFLFIYLYKRLFNSEMTQQRDEED